MHRIYRIPGDTQRAIEVESLKPILPSKATDVYVEYCFNYSLCDGTKELDEVDKEKLMWILTETFEPQNVSAQASFLSADPGNKKEVIIEVGPRLAFSTAWSSNCQSMLQACGVQCIKRIERSRRYKLVTDSAEWTTDDVNACCAALHDRMTECRYDTPLQSFDSGAVAAPVETIPLLTEGRTALERLNQVKGLGFDEWDIEFYTKMFVEQLKRNPTDVECFDLGQSNSEHSRHWYFGGKMFIDGVELPQTLFQMVKATLSPANKNTNSNSVIAFHDNSSAIEGCEVNTLIPVDPSTASAMSMQKLLLHPILTAETHNFPSGVAPFPGAETGTGGRLRDVQATGRGAHSLAGVSAYCVGNLLIPGHTLPWEDTQAPYPPNLASPLRIEVEASNGASDYGNKYGEPVVSGFTRSFGQRLPNGERAEFLKPIMFTAGVGLMDGRHSVKGTPEVGMVICKIGGPAYRIGMGGGAASSRVSTGSSADVDLDFNAVQRGDAEMENRMNRVIRACIELGENNPIVSIHDQGAGGNGNVLKEIVDPLGARLQLRNLPLGDPTLSVLEIWGAEYQENCAFLVRPDSLDLVLQLSERENCPVSPVGVVTGDGRVVAEAADGSTPFDLPLSLVLGKMPQKEFHFKAVQNALLPLRIPPSDTSSAVSIVLALSDEELSEGGCASSAPLLHDALKRVLMLLDVGSKRFLTNKVDRCVTGLVAQQQCVGPLHIPLADCAVLAQSHFATTGMAVSLGEQPIKGLLNNAAQARMTVCEALANLVFADVSSLADVKASCNWMWAAKYPEEGGKMYSACMALTDALVELGVGIDGGKDSLSMAAKVRGETVKSPGEVTLTCYVPCRDITRTLTPDFKQPQLQLQPKRTADATATPREANTRIVYVDLGGSNYRLGGSALATVYGQIGEDCPDVADMAMFRRCFNCIQELHESGLLLSGHDRSDGGVITTLLEMAFAGNCGFDVTLSSFRTAAFSHADYSGVPDYLPVLFAEEIGFIFEVLPEHSERVIAAFHAAGNHAEDIGCVLTEQRVVVRLGEFEGSTAPIIDGSMAYWRDVWESTSFALEALQCNPACVAQERVGLKHRTGAKYHYDFTVDPITAPSLLQISASDTLPSSLPRIAVIRQEGSNGDREMLSAFHAAGFEVWDVNMKDLLGTPSIRSISSSSSSSSSSTEALTATVSKPSLTLDRFRGIAFCGGFSYADVNDSAKGWAAVIKFNPALLQQFSHFRDRSDTFSLGVCNGCQLLALLGWVPYPQSTENQSAVTADSTPAVPPEEQPRFVRNTSGRFESRWSGVKILPSPAALLKGMEGSTLGVWVAHGEGKAYFPTKKHLTAVQQQHLAPIRYVDDNDEPTETYPFNPNGSPLGIAALCSADGRHLAMMPHPERCFFEWQMPYKPFNLPTAAGAGGGPGQPGPWLRLFQNAWTFCQTK